MLSINSTASTGTCNRGRSPLHLLRGGARTSRPHPTQRHMRAKVPFLRLPTSSAHHFFNIPLQRTQPSIHIRHASPNNLRPPAIGKAAASLYSRSKRFMPRGNRRQSFPQGGDLRVLRRAEKAQRQMEILRPHPTHTLRRPQRSHRIAQLPQCPRHPDGDEGSTNGHRKPANRRSNNPGSPPQSSPPAPSRTPWHLSLPN